MPTAPPEIYTLSLHDALPIFGYRVAFFRAKSPVTESLDEPGERGFHHRFPTGGPTFERLSRPVGHLFHFGLSAISNFERGPQEERLLSSRVGNAGFFLTQGELEIIAQKCFNFLFDLLGQGVASPYPDEPIVGISQVSHPDIFRVVDLPGW